MNLLNLLIALPALGFLLVLLMPKSAEKQARMVALVLSLVIFVMSLGLIGPVLGAGGGRHFEVNVPWMETPAIRYHVALDGLSLWLVILSTLLTPLCILISWKYIDHRIKEYYAFLLLLEVGVIGVFASLDLFLFYVFWEVTLVPMYFLIGIWGHDRRIYAAVKFFLYTMAGSVLMLAAIIYLYTKTGTFDYVVIQGMLASGRVNLSAAEQLPLFLAFFVAFAIKVPLWPLHTWLPDAHVEAPTAGSVMLASVMLKMGTYGIVRFCVPLFGNAARECAPYIVFCALVGIIVGALVAMVQPNMKKLVAYSSVSHLGFVVLGVFSFNQQGMDGAVYQMLNHGVSTGALFMLVGMLYERRHSLEIKSYGGVATVAPVLTTIFMITTLASIGLPVLNNFIGEFLVLQGAALANFRWAVFAALGVILSAVYMLWMFQRVYYGPVTHDENKHLPDLSVREWAVVGPLCAMSILMGVAPNIFLKPMEPAVTRIVQRMESREPMRVDAGWRRWFSGATAPETARARANGEQ